MGEKRMFSKTVTQSDLFLDMPLTTQAFYFHLGMEADDDGFVCSANKTLRMVGASRDDLNLLIAKGFVIPMQDGVCVIRHWRVHNYIRKDRYKETPYITLKNQLVLTVDNVYEMVQLPSHNELSTVGIPNCNQLVGSGDTQVKSNKVKSNKDNTSARMCRPSLEEVRTYCIELGNIVDPEAFIDHYSSNGWKVGNQPMKDWKAAVRNWERRQSERQPKAAAVKDTGFLTMEDIYGRKKG